MSAHPALSALLAERLPQLGGWSLTAYRVVWLFLLPVAVVAATADQFFAWSPTRFVETIALLGTSAILVCRRSADTIAAMIALAFLLWVVTASPAWAGMDAASVLAVLDRIRFLLFVTAMMLFPAGRFDPKWTRLGVGAIILSFGLGLAEAIHLVPSGFHILPAMACAALAVLAMYARLVSLPPGVQRQQIKWVALGFGLGLLLVAISRLGRLVDSRLFPTASALASGAFDIGVTLMALGVLTSLLRYRLYDADAAISRSSAIALVTLTLIGVFAAAEVVIQAASQRLFGDMAGTVSSAIAAAIAAALIAPLHGRVSTWAERRFQPALAEFRREVPDLLVELREMTDLKAMGEIILGRIERAARTSGAVILVGKEMVAARHMPAVNGHQMLESREKEDALFAHEVSLDLESAGRIGSLLLGPRPDGTPLGKDERGALEEIARPLARAVRAVQHNAAATRHQRSQAKRLAELARRLRLLEQPSELAPQ